MTATRRTPAIVRDSARKTDFFCLGAPDAAADLPADDIGGGMAIWGDETTSDGDVNVRNTIFRGS